MRSASKDRSPSPAVSSCQDPLNEEEVIEALSITSPKKDEKYGNLNKYDPILTKLFGLINKQKDKDNMEETKLDQLKERIGNTLVKTLLNAVQRDFDQTNKGKRISFLGVPIGAANKLHITPLSTTPSAAV